MKKMIIFDPAMCCPTGVCGPSVDHDLLRVATILNNLKNNGVVVERHNLTNNPQIFVDTKVISRILIKEGVEALPITMVDDVVVKKGAYPTDEEFCSFLEVPEEFLKTTVKKESKCCCGDGCC